MRYLHARSADIPQPKGRTLRPLCVAPHTRYDESRLWQRKRVGLPGEQSGCRHSASAQASYLAQGNIPARASPDCTGPYGGTTSHARLLDRGYRDEGLGAAWPSMVRYRLRTAFERSIEAISDFPRRTPASA